MARQKVNTNLGPIGSVANITASRGSDDVNPIRRETKSERLAKDLGLIKETIDLGARTATEVHQKNEARKRAKILEEERRQAAQTKAQKAAEILRKEEEKKQEELTNKQVDNYVAQVYSGEEPDIESIVAREGVDEATKIGLTKLRMDQLSSQIASSISLNPGETDISAARSAIAQLRQGLSNFDAGIVQQAGIDQAIKELGSKVSDKQVSLNAKNLAQVTKDSEKNAKDMALSSFKQGFLESVETGDAQGVLKFLQGSDASLVNSGGSDVVKGISDLVKSASVSAEDALEMLGPIKDFTESTGNADLGLVVNAEIAEIAKASAKTNSGGNIKILTSGFVGDNSLDKQGEIIDLIRAEGFDATKENLMIQEAVSQMQTNSAKKQAKVNRYSVIKSGAGSLKQKEQYISEDLIPEVTNMFVSSSQGNPITFLEDELNSIGYDGALSSVSKMQIKVESLDTYENIKYHIDNYKATGLNNKSNTFAYMMKENKTLKEVESVEFIGDSLGLNSEERFDLYTNLSKNASQIIEQSGRTLDVKDAISKVPQGLRSEVSSVLKAAVIQNPEVDSDELEAIAEGYKEKYTVDLDVLGFETKVNSVNLTPSFANYVEDEDKSINLFTYLIMSQQEKYKGGISFEDEEDLGDFEEIRGELKTYMDQSGIDAFTVESTSLPDRLRVIGIDNTLFIESERQLDEISSTSVNDINKAIKDLSRYNIQ